MMILWRRRDYMSICIVNSLEERWNSTDGKNSKYKYKKIHR